MQACSGRQACNAILLREANLICVPSRRSKIAMQSCSGEGGWESAYKAPPTNKIKWAAPRNAKFQGNTTPKDKIAMCPITRFCH